MKAIVCNKCGMVTVDEKIIKETLRLDLCTDRVGKFDEKHLCENCKKKFYNWLRKEEANESN